MVSLVLFSINLLILTSTFKDVTSIVGNDNNL